MKFLLTTLFALSAIMLLAQNNPGYKPGDAAIDFSLPASNGETVSLSSLPDAKGAIVIFTCNTCPVSKAYEKRIIALNTAFAAKGYPVIAINPNDPEAQKGEDFATMKVHAQENGFNFPYLFDKGQVITRAYGATHTPHVYLLQKEGDRFIVRYTGAIDNDMKEANPQKTNFVSDAVDALLAGKNPSPDATKAIGCTVKWKKS